MSSCRSASPRRAWARGGRCRPSPGRGRRGSPPGRAPGPGEAGGRWLFHEVDIARVELIIEIRREFAVDDEALSLMLNLLDQLYSLRRQMRRLCDALECQPPEVQDAIRKALPKAGGGG